MLTTDPAYALLEHQICPAMDDLLRDVTLTDVERGTIRRALEMLEEMMGDVQEREAEGLPHPPGICPCCDAA